MSPLELIRWRRKPAVYLASIDFIEGGEVRSAPMETGAIRSCDLADESSRRFDLRGNMRIVLNIVGLILVFLGAVWFLQGINEFPGKSFMNGQTRWSIYGGIAFVAGIIVFIIANRRKPTS
jgi:hypothetical protein